MISSVAVILCVVLCLILFNANLSRIREAVEEAMPTPAATPMPTPTPIMTVTPAPTPTIEPTSIPTETPAIEPISIRFEPNSPNNSITVDMSIVPKPITKSDGVSILLPNGIKMDGYSFITWNTRPDGNGTSFAANTVFDLNIASATTLYAQWIEAPPIDPPSGD